MSWETLAVLSAASLLITGFAATASKALQDFSRRELEVYCRRRRHTERFGEILDGYEQSALSLEALQLLGTVAFVLTVARQAMDTVGGLGILGPLEFAATVVAGTIMLIVVTSWIPEAIVGLGSASFVYHSWPLLQVVTRLLWPLTVGVKIVGAFFRRLADQPEKDDEEEAFDDEIRSIVTEGLHDGVLEEEEREMIEGVIELGETEVADIMTPRTNVDALSTDMSFDDVVAFAIRVGRTRIPMFEGSLDNVVGILYVKDLLKELLKPDASRRKSIRRLLRPTYSVPVTKRIDELLHEFRQQRNHLAVVVDEYQSIAGVVTIEDVLEEIVGEIEDESDLEQEAEFQLLEEGSAEVRGALHISTLNENLNIDLAEPDEYDTVAGLVISKLGRIPKAGESVIVDGTKLTVLEASRRRVDRIRIEPLSSAAQASE